MTRKSEKFSKEDWVNPNEAAAIISENSGHKISTDYIRYLGNQGKLETWKVSEHTKLYKRSDCEKYKVTQYTKKSETKGE